MDVLDYKMLKGRGCCVVKRLNAEELLGVFADVCTCFHKAQRLLSGFSAVQKDNKMNVYPQVILLQESMRFYMLAAYKIAGINQEVDSQLYDLLGDSLELAHGFGLGLVKLEGLACLNLNAIEINTVNVKDMDYFEAELRSAAKRIINVYGDIMQEAGIQDVDERMGKLLELL